MRRNQDVIEKISKPAAVQTDYLVRNTRKGGGHLEKMYNTDQGTSIGNHNTQIRGYIKHVRESEPLRTQGRNMTYRNERQPHCMVVTTKIDLQTASLSCVNIDSISRSSSSCGCDLMSDREVGRVCRGRRKGNV